MSTLLCVPIMVQDQASALADATEARNTGADLVEFRVDDVFAGEGDTDGERLILRLVAESPLPCIVTCRAASEGGNYDGDDMARVSLYERLGTASGPGEHPPRFIDVELATYTRSENLRQKVNLAVDHPGQMRDLRTSLILSSHDFQGRPADLTRRIVAMREQEAAKVHKIAFRARSLRDNLELFDLIAESPRPMIALGMGEFGLMSRVLAPKFGGFLTFAALRAAGATAPGQPTMGELLGMYRFRSISRETRVYGVIGWPVAHSLSPLVHNAGFESIGHNGVYLPMPVAPGYESFKATVGELLDHPRLDISGLSVTLPHKENLVRLAHERGWGMDDASSIIGSANTLVVHGGVARAMNTDVAGIADPLRAALEGERMRGEPAAIIGSGGVARSAAYVCSRMGFRVTLYNRTMSNALRLQEEFERAGLSGIDVAGTSTLSSARAAVVINCTPVGLEGGPDPTGVAAPVEEMARSGNGPGTLAFDTVYRPLVTPFLREARRAGWRTIDGAEMFVTQAAGQFEAWTGATAPRSLFDRFARESG